MKILIIQDFLRSGGTERQSILLANSFAAGGHATSLLTFRPGGALAQTVSSAVARRTLQPFDCHLDWFAPGLSATVRRIEPDVVLCMGRMANGYAGRLQSRFPGLAVVGTMRTGRKLPAAYVRSLAVVRRVITNSRAARDTLVRDYSVPGEKIAVIHNSLVFPAAAATADSAVREKTRATFGASGSTTVLLSVAMFRPEKNQRELIETLAALPSDLDWQLWLAGDGPARADCEQRVGALRLESRVKFPGFQRDPTNLYFAGDIAVHASRHEALSNFLIEAQAHGLPAVAFQAQGIEECFVPGETGWAIPAGQRAEFCAALERLIREPSSARATRSAAARAFARAAFAPDRQVAAHLDLFAQLR
jgi:glycosyltransferase involved in cell wall biosynthesis